MNRWKRDSETCAQERKREIEKDMSWTGKPENLCETAV